MRTLYSWAMALLAASAVADPSASFPFNSQLPPVARILQNYSYVFAANTFTSNLNISYALNNAPDWLSIDSATRTISGFPPVSAVTSGNTTGINMVLVATDSEGSTEMNATIVVSKNSGPALLEPLEDQISGFGDFSAPSSLLFYPSTAFNFSFNPSTFSYSLGSLNYYAVSGDGSPLPAWISFDSSTLMFSGTTPPFESLVSPPQVFPIQFVTSDIPGFSAISMPFNMVVGLRKLTSEEPLVVLNITKGTSVNYDKLSTQIKLDGAAVTPGSTVTVSTEEMPSWMSFDSTTWDLSGTPSSDTTSSKFLINFTDTLSDTLGVQFVVNLADSLFVDSVPSIEIVAGQPVAFNFTPYLSNASDVALTIDSNQSWLQINGLELVGTAPADLQPSTLQLTVTALSQTLTGVTQTIQAVVKISEAAASEPEKRKKSNKLTKGQIALAVVLPILCVLFSVLGIFCFLKQRRRRNPKPRNTITHEFVGALPPDLCCGEMPHAYNRTSADCEYNYIGNFPFQNRHHNPALESQMNGMRSTLSDSDLTARQYGLGPDMESSLNLPGSRQSEPWRMADLTREPPTAYIPGMPFHRDFTYRTEETTNSDQRTWYTVGPSSTFRRSRDLTAPSLPDIETLPQISDIHTTMNAGGNTGAAEGPQRREDDNESTTQSEIIETDLPHICFDMERSLPDIPSSDALPSIHESRTPSLPSTTRAMPLYMEGLTQNMHNFPHFTIRPDTSPHPDDVLPTPLALSRKASLSQADTVSVYRQPSLSHSVADPSIPRRSSRRAPSSRGSLAPSTSNGNIGPRTPRRSPSDKYKLPSPSIYDSMMGKENASPAAVGETWKSGAVRDHIGISYRDLYGRPPSDGGGGTRRSLGGLDAQRPYTSASRQGSLRGAGSTGGGDRRRTMHTTGSVGRRKPDSRRGSASAVMALSEEDYEGPGAGHFDGDEFRGSKPAFAREVQSMSTVMSMGSDTGSGSGAGVGATVSTGVTTPRPGFF